MIGHDFSRQITEKCETKYENENHILGHSKWKWEPYFGTEGVLWINGFREKNEIDHLLDGNY